MTLDPEGLLAMLDAAAPSGRSRSRCTTRSGIPPTACRTTACFSGRPTAAAGSSRSAGSTRCSPGGEAERCLAAGARGIKLHPRAQAFALVGLCEPIFALAEQAGVPILIHAGRGLPEAFGPELVELAQRHPGAPLVMAHVGVADQGVLADGLRGHPAAVFDTSWMNMMDTMALFARVPAERIVFGSGPALRAHLRGAVPGAADAGLPGGRHRDAAGTWWAAPSRRWWRADRCAATTPPRAPEQMPLDAKLARLHANLMLVLGIMFTGARGAGAGHAVAVADGLPRS